MTEFGRLIAPDTLEFRRTFAAPREKVWQFLVDPEKRKLWFCGGSTDDHPGGRIVFAFDHTRLAESEPPAKYASSSNTEHAGAIIEYDPPRRLVFTWFEAGQPQGSTVDISLSESGEGSTAVLLVHKGLVGRDMLLSVLAGWHGHFDLLAEVMDGPRTTDFWVRDQELEAVYDQRLD